MYIDVFFFLAFWPFPPPFRTVSRSRLPGITLDHLFTKAQGGILEPSREDLLGERQRIPRLLTKRALYIGCFRKIGVPQNVENPIKMADLGGKPTIFGNIYMCQVKDSLFMTKVIKHEVCQVKRSIKKKRGDR